MRADALHRLNDAGRRALAAHGIRTIIDMRAAAEAAEQPDALGAHDGVVYLNLTQQTDEASTLAGTTASRIEFNVTILEGCRPNFAAIALAIADARPGGIVVHCAAGKDRTGPLTALLLDLVGTTADEIGADYALTEGALAPLFDELIARAETDERRTRLERERRCPPETVLATLEHVRRRYGGSERYLLGCGVGAAALERIRARMVEA